MYRFKMIPFKSLFILSKLKFHSFFMNCNPSTEVVHSVYVGRKPVLISVRFPEICWLLSLQKMWKNIKHDVLIEAIYFKGVALRYYKSLLVLIVGYRKQVSFNILYYFIWEKLSTIFIQKCYFYLTIKW